MKIQKFFFILLALAVTVMSCSNDRGTIGVSWQLVQNQYKTGSQHKGELTFTNNSKYTLTHKNWEFYFSWFRSLTADQENDIVVSRTLNGDYNRILPTEKFPGLKPGESITFPLIGTHYAMNLTDAPSGGYFVIKRLLRKDVLLPAGETTVLPFPSDAALRRSEADHLPVQTAEIRYNENEGLQTLDPAGLSPVFPTPLSLVRKGGDVTLSENIDIFYYTSLGNEAAYLQERLQEIFGEKILKYKFRSPDFGNYTHTRIILNLRDGDPESYLLNVDPDSGVQIYGADAAGVFYGIQSLLSLMPASAATAPAGTVVLPRVRVEDAPRFSYRGMHLDVSRSFHSKAKILRFLDLMATYKLNKLHFHITDDEGWRVEIRALPELTQLGAFRGHTKDERDHLQPALGSGPFADPNSGNGSGYYTREDFIEILQFAHSRHIEVIPEIDMPGHIRSAIKAMESRYYRYMDAGKPDSANMYLLTDFQDTSRFSSAQRFNDNTANPCMESTYRFVDLVIEELVSMYKAADAPLTTLHIGGDEVPRGAFTHSPVCRAFLESQDTYRSPGELHKYFTQRVSALLKKHAIHTAGWEEVACMNGDGHREPDPSLVDEGIVAYIWNNVWGWGAEDLGYRIANTGFPIVMLNATNFYFDFAYNRDPDEPGLYWGGYSDTRSAWEFTPFDITKCAEKTLMGDPVLPALFEGKEALTETGKRNILGLSSALWSENLRIWEDVEYKTFPKVFGLAERAWSPQPEWARIEDKEARIAARESDWNIFVNRIGQFEFPRLDRLGVKYRIPLPGAVIEDGMLKANIRFPGLTLRYTTDGSEPLANSKEYTKPVPVRSGETIRIAAFTGTGRSSRVVDL